LYTKGEKLKKIMIVDDEKDLRELLNLVMQNEGFETLMAENGTDLLKKIDKFQPDLIVLDIIMPGPTTKEILEKLKEKKCNPKTIILTVVRFSNEEKEELFKIGNVVDCINKPFDMDDLINSVKKTCVAATFL
jgi:DNA-binding response OmpR family regulator